MIRGCTDYLEENTQYFIDVFEGDQSAANPPKWPDGGKSPHTLMSTKTKHVNTCMSKEESREGSSEEVISMDELTEILAEAEGVTPEEIEQGAEELDLAPPEEATVLNK